jgi:hypothetical protein
MAEESFSIVIISDRIVFNQEELQEFENFSAEDTKLLFSTLFFNLLENLSLFNSQQEFLIYLDESDKDFFSNGSDYIKANNYKIFYYQKKPDAVFLFDKIKNSKNKIIFFADVMGISPSSIKDTFNLLNSDENVIVAGIALDTSLCFIGLNHQTENMQNALQNSQRDYSKLLSLLKTEEHFIHTLNGFLRVKDISSFKDLYNDLSQKKSIEYCSQEMHEKFTHLFVEYKDLLK